MKYINQLTDDEIKELFIEVAEECLGSTIFEDNCFVQRNYDTIAVKGLINIVKIGDKKLPYPINFVLDDFHVHIVNKEIVVNWTMTRCYRKHMGSRCGNQYILDAFWKDYIMMRLRYETQIH